MKLEIISHCWHYSRMLMYQLSSLVLHPPKNIEVYPHVWYTAKDRKTRIMLRHFQELLPNLMTSRLSIDKLRKRAIGRNIAAHNTKADVVWFCDCDYFFGKGCLDAIVSEGIDEDRINFPSETLLHKTHDLGAEYAQRVSDVGIYDIDPNDFYETVVSRAIGGLQIVSGKLARSHGYCDPNHPSLRRRTRASCVLAHTPLSQQIWSTREDVIYRKIFSNPKGSRRLHLPNLYRLRQVTVEGDQGEHPVDTL